MAKLPSYINIDIYFLLYSNPHPKETFMVWKFPNKLPTAEQLKLKEQLMEEICQDKIRSTYQVNIYSYLYYQSMTGIYVLENKGLFSKDLKSIQWAHGRTTLKQRCINHGISAGPLVLRSLHNYIQTSDGLLDLPFNKKL